MSSPTEAGATSAAASPGRHDGQVPFLQLVAFVVAGNRCAFPLEAVERAAPMAAVHPVPGAPRVVLGAIDVAGQVVPVVDLRRRLALPPHDYGVAASLLIVRTPRRTVAVAADEVTGVASVDPLAVAPAARIMPGLDQVAGIAALPGGLLFIHDLETLLLPTEERELGQALAGERS